VEDSQPHPPPFLRSSMVPHPPLSCLQNAIELDCTDRLQTKSANASTVAEKESGGASDSGLMAVGPTHALVVHQRAVSYVGQILKGEKLAISLFRPQ
jgi:hypothetical protein